MTFYRLPGERVLKNWYERAPEGFTFTLKAPRLITHIKKLKDTGEYIKNFYELSETTLKEKLGCILWQLPPQLHFNSEGFEAFLKQLSSGFINVIEFRNESWWQKRTYELIKSHKAIFCTVSGPTMPEEITVTGSVLYVRFHGNKSLYRSCYSKKEMSVWAEKINRSAERNNVRTVYCYFNNDFNAFAVKNAGEMVAAIRFLH